MRISQTLQNCDKCGNQLPVESQIDPKRKRQDTGDASSKRNNGHSTVNGTGSASSSAAPVPQALYVNKNAVTAPDVRPQAVYRNAVHATRSPNLTTSDSANRAVHNANSHPTSVQNRRFQSAASGYTMHTQGFPNSRPPTTANYHVNPSPPNPNAMITVLPSKVILPAQQIRIGAQKFKPLTPVEFKDDGILFTLRGKRLVEEKTHSP